MEHSLPQSVSLGPSTPIVVACAFGFVLAACGSNLSTRWDDKEAASVERFMEKCERRHDNSMLVWECGIAYQFAALTTPLPHRTFVTNDIADTVEAGDSGALERFEHRGTASFAGAPVEFSEVRYVGKVDANVPPSMEVYVSQVVEGERQVFSCWHTLAMVKDDAEVKTRLRGCLKGLEVLLRASR